MKSKSSPVEASSYAYDDDTSGDAGDDEILLPQYGESQEVLFLTFVFLSCAS